MRTCSLLAVLLSVSLLSYGSHHRSRQPHGGQAGVFDFYLFVLSWSPEFCYSHTNAAECAAHQGFVVHGLWPQNKDGSYPSNCQTDQPSPSNPAPVAGIMPPEIVQHEWQTHGACSGLSGDAYLALIRSLHDSIHIPPRFASPSSSFAISPHEFKHEFEAANSNLSDAALAIQLRGGRYLNAIEICMTKSPTPVPLACSGIRDATGGTFLVPPIR